MKKISLIFIALFLACLGSFSQTPIGGSNKSMTVEEANKLNGIAQPTINGKPYSQYKTEQDALKQQREMKTQSPNLPGQIAITPSSNLGAVGKKAQVVEAAKTGINDGGVAPEERKIDPSLITKEEEKVPAQVRPDYFANPNSTRLGAPEVPVIDKPVIETKPERKPVEEKKVVTEQPKDLTKSSQPTTQTVPLDNGVKVMTPAEKPVKKD